MQRAKALADRAAVNLPDQRQHLCAGRETGRERGAAVEEAGPRHHRIDRRPSGRERGAERHIGRALLVPRMHDADRVARVEHGVEQVIALHAGQAVDCRDAVRDERSDDRIASAHQRHEIVLCADAGAARSSSARSGMRFNTSFSI